MDLDRLRDTLEGTPYSPPDDPTSVELLAEMLPREASLESRCLAVREGIAQRYEEQLAVANRTTEIYESNRIEGKLATLKETYDIMRDRALLKAGDVLSSYTLTEALADEPKVQDVVGLAAARILVDEYLRERDRPLLEADLRDFHSLILRGHHSAGRYKQYLNEIEGARHVPTPPSDVPDAMHHLVEWLNSSDAPLVWRSAVAHAWLTHIHPFDDGNGRIARLVANFVLGHGCYPPLIIKSSADRARYLNALGQSDEAGDLTPLVRLFVKVLNRGVKLMERPDFAWQLFQRDLQMRESDPWQRWQETVNRFFTEVAGHLLVYGIELEAVGWLDSTNYELLRQKERSGNSWLAKVRRPGRAIDLLIWAGHLSAALDRDLERDEVQPALFLAEKDPSRRAIKPYRPSVSGEDPLHDELVLFPDTSRAILRRGTVKRNLSLPDAAELYAALLRRHLGL